MIDLLSWKCCQWHWPGWLCTGDYWNRRAAYLTWREAGTKWTGRDAWSMTVRWGDLFVQGTCWEHSSGFRCPFGWHLGASCSLYTLLLLVLVLLFIRIWWICQVFVVIRELNINWNVWWWCWLLSSSHWTAGWFPGPNSSGLERSWGWRARFEPLWRSSSLGSDSGTRWGRELSGLNLFGAHCQRSVYCRRF